MKTNTDSFTEPYKAALTELKKLYDLKLRYSRLTDPSSESANLYKHQIAEQQKIYEKSIPKEGTSDFNAEQANQFILRRIDLENKLEIQLHKTAQALVQKDNAELSAAGKLSELQQKLTFQIDNTLLGDLSSGDHSTLLNLRDGLTQIDISSEKAEQQIKEFGAAYRQLKSEIKNGKLVDNDFGVNIKSSDSEFKNYIANLKNVTEEQIKMQDSSRTIFGSNGEQIRYVNAQINDGSGNWQNYSYAVNSASGEVRELQKNIEQADSKTNNLSQTASKATEYFTALASSMAVNFIKNSIDDALNDLKNIDKQLVNISKVSNLDTSGFKDAANEALGTASKWGRTATSYLEATEAFAKVGRDNYKELSEISLIGQSAGDMSSKLTNEWLIASDATFNYGGNVEKLTALLDAQNQVSNRSSVEMGDLAAASKEFSSMAAIGGESEKTMTVLIAAGVASTKKSGNEIGNALESLTMKIRRVKGETKDGELIDDTAISKAR